MMTLTHIPGIALSYRAVLSVYVEVAVEVDLLYVVVIFE